MAKVTRTLVRYHGGKWKLAPWIISHLPEHRVYVEPFGGAASVLLKKQRSYAEVYNDLDSEMVNLFRVARDRGGELRVALELTPFAREEFDLAWQPTDDPLERARRTVVRAGMGRDSASATSGRKTSFRAYVGDKRPASTMADWRNYPRALDAIIERLRGVAIEHRDAKLVMSAYDGQGTVHYVDPPYVFKTRDEGRSDYRHELTDTDHQALLAFLGSLRGKVVLSGYDCELYNDLLPGWGKVTKQAFADGARARTEVLWLSPNCREHQPMTLGAPDERPAMSIPDRTADERLDAGALDACRA